MVILGTRYSDQALLWSGAKLEKAASSSAGVEAREVWARAARKSSRDRGIRTVVGLGDTRASSGKNSLGKGPDVGR